MDSTNQPADPERALALTYAPEDARGVLAALLTLDETLAAVPRSTSEPALGQMRLVWWRDALTALDTAPPPATPVLVAVADQLVARGVSGERMAAIAEGWAMLIEQEHFDDASLDRYAELRGGTLFAAAAEAMQADGAGRAAGAGAGWALVDLALHTGDQALSRQALALGRSRLAGAMPGRWNRRGRALGALGHLAWMDARLPAGTAPPVGSPRRVARLAWHRMTGR